jgi:hypothetical protein
MYNITAQKGQAFTGYKEYTRANGTRYSEELSGVINTRNEIFIAEDHGGVIIGDLIGPDSMELNYVEDGPDAKALLVTLTRQKT